MYRLSGMDYEELHRTERCFMVETLERGDEEGEDGIITRQGEGVNDGLEMRR